MNIKKNTNTTEITCPNCGETIVLDESAYKSVAQQVRDREFNAAVLEAKERMEREMTAMKATHKAELDALAARKDAERQAVQTEAEQEIATVYADAKQLSPSRKRTSPSRRRKKSSRLSKSWRHRRKQAPSQRQRSRPQRPTVTASPNWKPRCAPLTLNASLP